MTLARSTVVLSTLVFSAYLGTAQAGTITRSYHVVANNLTNSSAIIGLATWTADFTVSFDPTQNYTGAALDAYSSSQLNSGSYGPYVFSYSAASHQLQVGDNCPSTNCTLSGNDAILNLNVANPYAPVFSQAIYRELGAPGGTDFDATAGTATLAGGPIGTITRDYHFTASNFTNSNGDPGLPNWTADFTVTFDPTQSYAGAALDAYSSGQLNGSGYGPYVFSYEPSSAELEIGDNCPSTACTLSSTDAIIFLDVVDPDAPGVSAIYRDPSFTGATDFRPSTASIILAGTEPAAIPEPTSIILLGVGLIGLGLSRRRGVERRLPLLRAARAG